MTNAGISNIELTKIIEQKDEHIRALEEKLREAERLVQKKIEINKSEALLNTSLSRKNAGLEQKLAIAVGALEAAINESDVFTYYELIPRLREALAKIKAPIGSGNDSINDPNRVIDSMTKDDHENTLLDEYPYAEHADDFMKGLK